MFLTGYHSSGTDIHHTVLSCRNSESLEQAVQLFVEAPLLSNSYGSDFGGHELCVRIHF